MSANALSLFLWSLPMLFFILSVITLYFCLYFGFILLLKLLLLLTYLLVWTPAERRRYCPNGLLFALFFE